MIKCSGCKNDFDDNFLQNGYCSSCFVAEVKRKNEELGLVKMEISVYPELISTVKEYVDSLNQAHKEKSSII